MSLYDMVKGTAAVTAVAAVSLGALAIGTLVTRHPNTARRALRTMLQGVQRVGLALAQTREDLGDVWAEARDELRGDLAFADWRLATRDWAASMAGAAGTAAKSNGSRPNRRAAATPKRSRSARKSEPVAATAARAASAHRVTTPRNGVRSGNETEKPKRRRSKLQ